MSDILVTSPFKPFTLPTQFKAVFNGFIYCGTVDAVDPSVSQVQVYLVNEAGDKVPVAQPLRTNAGGFLVYNGQPAKFVTDSNHSLLVQDSFNVQVWYAPNMAFIDPDYAIAAAIGKITIDSVLSLRNMIPDEYQLSAIASSYRTGSGIGGGVFEWDSDSMLDDDGGSVIAPQPLSPGRWIRVNDAPYTPEMYGADGTKTNDPDAIYRLLANQKLIQFLGGKYYYNQEFLTNGHTITGTASETFDAGDTGTHIVFFGNFAAAQAYRNEGKKTVLKNIIFEPESWDVVTGYTGHAMRLFRGVDAENCCWNKFKKFGMDLWEDVANAYVPYYSQFRNCSWDYCGFNGIRLAQGANSIQIYGGTCRWNGSPAYGVAPVDNSTGWDGLFIGHVVEAGMPAPDNPFSTQGLIIEGIDCSYNARYGANLNYCNQSRIHIGYCEDNKQGKDIRIADVVACDINILVSQQGADIVVPTRGYGVPRSDANYPNRIIVNGEYYGSGSKDAQGRYNDFGNNPKQGVTMLAAGTAGATYIRAREEGDGSVEFLPDGNVQILYRCPPVPGLPAASEKWLGVIVRNTSTGPNPIQVCVESSPGVYVWRTITTS